MERRKVTREFKLEAVKLIKEREVTVAQASRDLGVHGIVLRNWVKPLRVIRRIFSQPWPDEVGAAEVARLKREVNKLMAERDIPTESRSLLGEGIDMKFGFVTKRRRILPAEWLCSAFGVSPDGSRLKPLAIPQRPPVGHSRSAPRPSSHAPGARGQRRPPVFRR